MNLISSKLALAVALVGSLIVSCAKEPVELPQIPGQDPQGQQPSGITLTFETPQQTAIQADSAIIWLEQAGRGQQQARVKVKATNDRQGTGLIQLPAGNYVINYVMLTNAQGNIVYASPRQQSEKAAQVARPLPQSIVAASQSGAIAMEVLPVAVADQALMFGYPYDVFKTQQMVSVSVRIGITVGKTLYNNFEAPLEIKWYDAEGQAHVQLLQLPAQQNGLHTIGLPREGSRFELRLRKWEKTYETVVTANELQAGMIIALTGDMEVRKLMEEFTWHEVQGEYRPFSRKTYEYDAAGRVIKTMYYQKIPQKQDLELQTIEEMYYQGDRLASVYFANGNHVRNGHVHFTYNANNRITHMEQITQAGTTYAAVEYRTVGSKEEVTLDYLFDNGNAMEYKFVMENGNKISEGAISSTAGGESSKFTYDQQINPYNVLGLQDIFLRHLSRNNKIGEERGYSGNIPTNVPYNYTYSYDRKGYPVQLITSYKGYTSGQHLYRAKTQYIYNK